MYIVLLIQSIFSFIGNFSYFKHFMVIFFAFLNTENTGIQCMARQLITSKGLTVSMSVDVFLLDL